jgi:hypothetical protein
MGTRPTRISSYPSVGGEVCPHQRTPEGGRVDRAANLAKTPSSSAFSGRDRDNFEQSVKLGCVQSQRADPLTVKIGTSEAKIAVYCECMSAGLAEAMSLEELRYAVSNGKPPASLLDKRTMMAQLCAGEALGK